MGCGAECHREDGIGKKKCCFLNYPILCKKKICKLHAVSFLKRLMWSFCTFCVFKSMPLPHNGIKVKPLWQGCCTVIRSAVNLSPAVCIGIKSHASIYAKV